MIFYDEQSKGDQQEKLVAFVLPIKQDRSRCDPVKTEYGQDQGAALVEPDEEAVELRSPFFAEGSETLSGYFVETSSEWHRKKPEGLK